MATVTDPARELADMCTSLATVDAAQGAAFLAQRFQVDPWSTEFFQIIFCICQRIDDLCKIVENLAMDDDLKERALSNITMLKVPFSQNGMSRPWNQTVSQFLHDGNLNVVRMISPQIRPLYSYPSLTQDEIAQLIGEIDGLLSWLETRQLAENDFIRQAIIDGLQQLKFRLARVGWLGLGYALQSLRDVIGAYLALERGMPDDNSAPGAEAILKKTATLVQGVLSRLVVVKDTVEVGELMLKAYGAATLMIQGKLTVQALLTFTGNG